MLKLSIVISVFIVSLGFAQSDTMVVEMANGKVINYPISKIKEISFSGIPTNVKDNSLLQNVLRKFTLYQNYTNPFNPSTTIEYQIPSSGHVAINIYNIQAN